MAWNHVTECMLARVRAAKTLQDLCRKPCKIPEPTNNDITKKDMVFFELTRGEYVTARDIAKRIKFKYGIKLTQSYIYTKFANLRRDGYKILVQTEVGRPRKYKLER